MGLFSSWIKKKDLQTSGFSEADPGVENAEARIHLRMKSWNSEALRAFARDGRELEILDISYGGIRIALKNGVEVLRIIS